MSYNCRHSFLFMASRQVEGDRGAGARKNKGRERAGTEAGAEIRKAIVCCL